MGGPAAPALLDLLCHMTAPADDNDDEVLAMDRRMVSRWIKRWGMDNTLRILEHNNRWGGRGEGGYIQAGCAPRGGGGHATCLPAACLWHLVSSHRCHHMP